MIAKRTNYFGVTMRSRLEARWALFFDLMGIEWNYEDEGYILQDGTKYLPDFWLPDFNGGTFVECKPEELSNEQKQKCEMLCLGTQNNVLMLVSYPSFLPQDVFVFENGEAKLYCGYPNGNFKENSMFFDDAFLNDDVYREAVVISRTCKFEKWDEDETISIIKKFKNAIRQ